MPGHIQSKNKEGQPLPMDMKAFSMMYEFEKVDPISKSLEISKSVRTNLLILWLPKGQIATAHVG